MGDDFTEDDCSYMTKRDLQAYMDKKMYKNDNEFFSVFSKLFTKIDKEEEMEEDTKTVHRDAAPFGDINSTREETMKFYQEWGGFSTYKQFAYVDTYNPADAPNRRIKRLIEQENKKERNKEKAKFNDKLRDLLQYIKNRDPRIA